MAEILQTQSLSKQYQMGEVTVDALHGVDLAVDKGEFVAVMGPSGSGKSTLLHLMGGLDTPSDGDVMLGGKRLAHLDDDEITIVRRRQVGFVFQFFNLLPTLTAAENVALPLLIDGKRIEEYAGRVDELLDLVGLGERRDHRPDQLSGGEQQRVAIARAIVTDPDLIVADEPTGDLDARNAEEVLSLLRHLKNEFGKTIVMVSHDPRALRFVDEALHLDKGVLLEGEDAARAHEAIMIAAGAHPAPAPAIDGR